MCHSKITHGSLFSGIGGFELAAEWMGWINTFHCEIDPFCRKVLNYYWPNAISYEDITKTDFSVWRNRIDILTGGFPCQPYSVAGKRLGKNDNRHLWPEMLRAIREIKPSYVVGENVAGIISWNTGMVFDEVQADLENEGYEVWAYILPACAVNAPHRRDRVWFIAKNSQRNGCLQRESKQEGTEIWEQRNTGAGGENRVRIQKRADSNPNKFRLEGRSHEGVLYKTWETRNQQPDDVFRISNGEWNNFPAQPPVCSGNDGISTKLDGITFSKWRKNSIKAYGNAIVPQVAYRIFLSITNAEKFH